MGRYRSEDSDDEHSRKSKKRKKRRSRSSSSSSQLSHISNSRSKKSRKKHRRSSRSRSRSRDRKHVSRSSRRSRSKSPDRYSSRKRRSDSRSPGRKSSKRGRTRSKSPSSRKRRSYSRSRRSRSPSRDRRKKSDSRERSYSADRASSTRSSVDRHKATGQPAGSPRLKGYVCHTLAEQAEERLRQAMKAATSADEKLQARSATESLGSYLYSDTKSFAASVSAIESDSFVASSFKSSRSTKIKEEAPESGMSHDDAIFGSLAISGFTLMPDPDTKPIQLDPDSIMHPSLYCDPQEKMERWISRLVQLRRRKLEGDVI
ncbi:unnamed protein product [Candidula unifasciata]|uniref:Uncharacterized protein n=1 Tax=Candidula unifasciata TaxID=100452 RepID=A0A8S3ZI19_9EUPU|nr:unnamed protein product [Candidula unifasciata]